MNTARGIACHCAAGVPMAKALTGQSCWHWLTTDNRTPDRRLR
jgi:hypothetical protein